MCLTWVHVTCQKNPKEFNSVEWKSLISKKFNQSSFRQHIVYPKANKNYKSKEKNYNYANQQQQENLEGFCRPGFIIIGAGKCGTSSLYHYLVGHDRVLPAKEKQIHYFKYFTQRPMSWYLSHFYSTEDFLSSGGLMTGEASPGYLPYPDVAHRIKDYMKTKAGNGYNQLVAMPKIITIVRDPLERSYSSYKYNYIRPNLEKLQKEVKKARHSQSKRKGFKKKRVYNYNDSGTSRQYYDMIQSIVSKNMTDDQIIQEYFFSFDELIEAEMELLENCLRRGGPAEIGAKQLYGTKEWAKTLFNEREERIESNDLPPLMTLDESCYGGYVSSSLPRRQWKELVELHPDKMINVGNLHLVQSLVGRSLYSLPLEWWYEMYPNKDLLLVCNEDLKNQPSDTMSEVSEFLGLPYFNFDPVVNEGLYNVGGNEGYNKITTWVDGQSSEASDPGKSGDGIPVSDELRKKFLSFVQPYNKRLFEMTRTKCNW